MKVFEFLIYSGHESSIRSRWRFFSHSVGNLFILITMQNISKLIEFHFSILAFIPCVTGVLSSKLLYIHLWIEGFFLSSSTSFKISSLRPLKCFNWFLQKVRYKKLVLIFYLKISRFPSTICLKRWDTWKQSYKGKL